MQRMTAHDFNNQGVAYYKQGKFSEAVSAFTRAIEGEEPNLDKAHRDDRGKEDFYCNRGLAYYALGKVRQAYADCMQVLCHINGNHSPAYSLMGIIQDPNRKFNDGNNLFQKEKFDEAISAYTQALELTPNYTDAFLNRECAYESKQLREKFREADTYYSQGQFTEAGACYHQIKEIRTTNHPVHMDGNYAAYINLTYRAAKINSESAYLAQQAQADYSQGKWDEAISKYTQALELDPYKWLPTHHASDWLNPNYAAVYNGRGDVYCKQGEWDRAISDYIQALKLNPNYTAAYVNRGHVYQIQGRLVEAISDFTKALKIEPHHPMNGEHLKTALLKMTQSDMDKLDEPSLSSALKLLSSKNQKLIYVHLKELNFFWKKPKEETFIVNNSLSFYGYRSKEEQKELPLINEVLNQRFTL